MTRASLPALLGAAAGILSFGIVLLALGWHPALAGAIGLGDAVLAAWVIDRQIGRRQA